MGGSFTVIIATGQRDRMTEINRKVVEWFQSRCIGPGTLEEAGITSGVRRPLGEEFEVVPDSAGEVICFPYEERGQVVNEKYRERGKRFYQKTGGKKVLYGCDVLSDSQLIEGRAPLVIVEGEIDYLSVREAGNPFVVSVPDGAPPAFNKPHDVDQFDPLHDTKYSYIHYHWNELKLIKRIVIATDSDDPGKRLAEELVRRLGRARCSFVSYPENCKDMNEVLTKHGPATVAELIARAKPYPVSGYYEVDDIPPEPDFVPVSTGFYRLDDYLKIFFPSFMVVTGFAGSGKSTLVNQMVAQLALTQGWRVAIASFEMRVNPFISESIKAVYHGMRGGTPEQAHEWFKDHFGFIMPEPSEDSDNFDVEWLIERAVTAVVRKGIRVLVIDPWNEIEHAVRRGESFTDYTGRAIRFLKRFGREFEVAVIVVAHPTKKAAEKPADQLSLYDVSDSAHFANKADFGLVVKRCGGEHDYVSEVMVRKVRYQPMTGAPGSITLTYDPVKRIFSQ